MGIVFWFSHQVSEDSSAVSGNTIRTILNLLPGIENLPDIEKEELVEFLQPIARKLAHLSIYLLGGVLIAVYLNEYCISDEKKILISIAMGAIYAVSDEIHQFFIPGRACMARDVLIDTIGIAIGTVAVYILVKLIKRGVQNEQKSSNHRGPVDMQE